MLWKTLKNYKDCFTLLKDTVEENTKTSEKPILGKRWPTYITDLCNTN